MAVKEQISKQNKRIISPHKQVKPEPKIERPYIRNLNLISYTIIKEEERRAKESLLKRYESKLPSEMWLG